MQKLVPGNVEPGRRFQCLPRIPGFRGLSLEIEPEQGHSLGPCLTLPLLVFPPAHRTIALPEPEDVYLEVPFKICGLQG